MATYSASNKVSRIEAEGWHIKPEPFHPHEPQFQTPQDLEAFVANLTALRFWLQDWYATFKQWASVHLQARYWTRELADMERIYQDLCYMLNLVESKADSTTYHRFTDPLAILYQTLIRRPISPGDASNGVGAGSPWISCYTSLLAGYYDVFGDCERRPRARALPSNIRNRQGSTDTVSGASESTSHPPRLKT